MAREGSSLSRLRHTDHFLTINLFLLSNQTILEKGRDPPFRHLVKNTEEAGRFARRAGEGKGR